MANRSVRCKKQSHENLIQLKTKGIRGTLPLNLQTLTELIVLEIFQNRISGPIPDLSGLTRLHTLNLNGNLFDYVPIPKNLFSGMTSLQEAYLENNPFSPWEMTMDKQKTGIAIHICYEHTMTLLVLLIVCLSFTMSPSLMLRMLKKPIRT
uniref:Leucine-rich repeat-containing N-terminal plant-type domain-containing protein n=1 Tax=Brassica oleracea TaxID=3712 RepID=A0A3P6H0T5_BRAOL|nr:unnamed protein product [Brassica oleracea]